MKRYLLLLAAFGAVAAPQLTSAPVANEGLANSIIAARQKNAQLMQQFSWNTPGDRLSL